MMEVCCKETEPEFLGKGRNVLRRPLVFAAAAFGGGIGIGYGAKLCTEEEKEDYQIGRAHV